MSILSSVMGGNPASWVETAERAITAVERLAEAIEEANTLRRVPDKCAECEVAGRLRCRLHGPVVVPAEDVQR